jgi:formylglycine-generating enzyme required for sulfatase activity
MAMDDYQLIVNHTANHPEVGGFVDTFRLSDGNRTSIRNTPGSNEYLGGYASHMRLDNNGGLLYSISGAIEDTGPFQEFRSNKTISISTPLTSSSPVISHYPSSSGKFTLTDKYFVGLDNYTSQNLQNNPQNYHVLRVYPKDANLRPSPTHTVDLNSSVNLEMIWVEPGTFTMGSPISQGSWLDRPEHNVTITHGFYLGKYEITQAQYEEVMAGNNEGLSAKPSNWADNPNRPVENVDINDIKIFLSRLNSRQQILDQGWEYSLPVEEEWEYACRAGTKTEYFWGNDISKQNANYNWDGGTFDGIDLKQTCDVGLYPPNPWGFFDMHGNVWEITGTALDENNIVQRGAGWGNNSDALRSAYRGLTAPNVRHNGIGFRVAYKRIQ